MRESKQSILEKRLGLAPHDLRVFPEKCQDCLKFLTYCQYWDKGFKCDMEDIFIQMRGKWF